MENKPHISFKAQEIFQIFNFPITNSVLTSLIVVLIFFVFAFFYYRDKDKPAQERSMIYYFVAFVVKALYQFFYSVLGPKIDSYFPLLASFFLFILFNNWFGLLPGVGSIMLKINEHGTTHYAPILRGGTADLNTTISLAIISVVFTNIASIQILGFKKFIARFYRLKDPMSYFIGTLEVVSEFSKVVSFSFRLFGNIFAGEVLLSVIAFLIPVFAAFPFLLLEVFVGFIQAIVFSTLSAVFINVAIEEHH
jgi:F-type H+-transporting ATPase subunit a